MLAIHPFFYMCLAGIFFGSWPLVMNNSGLSGVQSAMWFGAGAAVLIVVFGIATQGIQFDSNARWGVVILASALGGIGLVFLNVGLANTTPQQVSKLFMIMVLAQIAVPAIYHAITNGGLDFRTAAGITAALVSALLLI